MSQAKPQFSVVIPLYNKRPYIRRAVDSVLAQTLGNFEVVVVDDGSTDSSCDELQDIHDARLRLIQQKNMGEGAARNRGIMEAHADWLAFLDADDMWFTDHLEELSQVIEIFPETGIVSTGNLEARDGSDPDAIPERPSNIRMVDYFAEAARDIGFINASSIAAKRTVLTRCGGFGPFKAGADLECWAKIALHYPVAVSDRITALYFRGTGGVMEQLAAEPPTRISVSNLEDISPSVGLVSSALSEGNHIVQATSLETYINSRLFSSVKQILYKGDIKHARKVTQLSIGQVPIRLRVAQSVLKLPDTSIAAGLYLYRLYRRFAQ